MSVQCTLTGSSHLPPCHSSSDHGPTPSGHAQSPLIEAPEAGRDRVILSKMTRAASMGDEQLEAELAHAREAMLALPPLSVKQVAGIFKRVRSGYYSQPGEIQRVARELASTLTRMPPL